MHKNGSTRRGKFWRRVGLAVGSALLLSLLYMIIRPTAPGSTSPASRAWSDGLCISALLLGVGSGLPFIFDAGRGLMLPNKMGANRERRQQFWDEERAKRETGIQITFALALAAFFIGILSFLASL